MKIAVGSFKFYKVLWSIIRVDNTIVQICRPADTLEKLIELKNALLREAASRCCSAVDQCPRCFYIFQKFEKSQIIAKGRLLNKSECPSCFADLEY